MRKRPIVATLIAALVVLTALAVGCAKPSSDGQVPAEPTETAEETVAPPAAETAVVNVYFVRGERVGVGGREVAEDDTEELAKAAMEALVAGPTPEEREFGLGTAIPEGTVVHGVKIDAGTATVDLSDQFQSGGGSLSMLLRVTQVVCTLTQFEDVDEVAFELDGKKTAAIGGEGIIVDPPVNRVDFEGQLPAILVERPYPGQEVTSPLTVTGSSNTFEATHQLNVTDPDGLIVADETVNASSGTGTRGSWSTAVEFGPPKFDGLGAVIVFEISAKDGTQTNVVEVPVRMKR